MGHGGDVVQELVADHDEVKDYFQQLAKATEPERRREIADQLTIELVRHSVAEEQHLYPAVREHLEDGDRIADKEIADHSAAEEEMKRLESLDAAGEEFTQCVVRLRAEVLAHIKDEEENLFPALRRNCPQQTLDELGEYIRRAKELAPTRPHPSSPSKPPANKLLAPGLGLVDRARDFVSGRGKTS
ncbi:hemerythrin domain-containing protein [Streptomyces antimicrobicus]|uniref:Hemerythrin domain-containing protein n=1 Tax=Streptomyces antimicrobicus TaxID=2883108 RepID=A0ABS8B5B8_9ACTN|nr:hemerythrin domain-containing protein [Streptomyces antimicrobicus]MCB5179781.1 hemerythrin domain-containing protein [Streptomyces antimicrobicus]